MRSFILAIPSSSLSSALLLVIFGPLSSSSSRSFSLPLTLFSPRRIVVWSRYRRVMRFIRLVLSSPPWRLMHQLFFFFLASLTSLWLLFCSHNRLSQTHWSILLGLNSWSGYVGLVESIRGLHSCWDLLGIGKVLDLHDTMPDHWVLLAWKHSHLHPLNSYWCLAWRLTLACCWIWRLLRDWGLRLWRLGSELWHKCFELIDFFLFLFYLLEFLLLFLQIFVQHTHLQYFAYHFLVCFYYFLCWN